MFELVEVVGQMMQEELLGVSVVGWDVGGFLLFCGDLRRIYGFVLLDCSDQGLVADIAGGLRLIAGGGTNRVDLGELGDGGVLDNDFPVR